MPDESVQIKVGFQADTASNRQALAEIEKVKAGVLDVQKSMQDTSRGGNDLQKALSQLARAAQIDKIAKEMGEVARQTDNTGDAVAELTKKLKALGATKDEIRSAAGAFEVERNRTFEVPDEPGDNSGGGGNVNVNKFRGVASMFGGGDLVGFADDAMDAADGVQQLASAAVSMGPAGIAAAAAVVLVVAVMGDLAAAAQEQADAINESINSTRSVLDEIAGGATSDDIRENIEQLKFRAELEKSVLAESQASYQEFVDGLKQAFGPLAGLIQGVLQIIDPREEALHQQIETSNKLIGEAEAKERAYNDALSKGLTAKADAKQAADDLKKAQDKAARDQEASARKQEQAAEKAAREAEQAAKQQEQALQQQADAAAKNADAMRKINQGAIDNIADIQRKAKDAAVDGRNKLITDLNNLNQKFNDDEIGAVIKANQAEQQALKDHQRTIKDLMDRAADAEEDARENRNFLQLAQARKDAQKELNKEPEQFTQGAEDRAAAFEQERQERLRQLEIARRDRNQAYGIEDQERRAGIERALRDNQINKQRQLRDQQSAYASEQATLARHLQSLLGIRGQFMSAEMQMMQRMMGGARLEPAPVLMSQNSTVNNTTMNNNIIGTGGMLATLRLAGFGR